MPPKSFIPKYSIRIGLIWLLPGVNLLMGYFHSVPVLLAAALTPIEVPKVRARLFGSKAKKVLPCMRVPPLLRLSVLWLLQVWWLLLWRAGSPEQELSGASEGEAQDESSSDELGSLAWQPQTMSVVLPCAGEGEYALNTVRAVHGSLPEGLLQEIIVVDDGTMPPLSESFLDSAIRERYGVQIIRHAETVGLIGAKKDGGDAATGDIVVFFDCHVAPQPGWHRSFMRLIGDNYRRIVTPVITDLDVGTWKQRGGNRGQAKCYLTWDADFKWFNSDDEYVPILSGGLLGMSKRWWNETGGYDQQMIGWGGENLDQSLRSWLCGGEIMMAKDSFVAHMWRKPEDPRTRAKYQVKAGAAAKNRLRAAVAWFGEFSQKLSSFPGLQSERTAPDGSPWYGDLSNILEVRDRLQCKSFAWFMHRFKHVYEDGGLIPSETFLLRVDDSVGGSSSSLCLTYEGYAGTSPNGRGSAVLKPCNPSDERQRWHGANRDITKQDRSCCSGLRAWNTDQCVRGVEGQSVGTFVCDVSGQDRSQGWRVEAGQLVKTAKGSFRSSQCIVPKKDRSLEATTCSSESWSKDEIQQPIEAKLYHEALVSMGVA